MILTGNVALETMGFKTFGFGGGREDTWEPDQDVYWGRETTWLGGDVRYAHGSEGVAKEQAACSSPTTTPTATSTRRNLENPLAAVQMGLIYVNPEGPDGNPDPLAAAARHPRHLRPHGHERRGDRRADRRRPHLRQDPRRRPVVRTSAPSPKRPGIESQGFGWKNSFGTGKGADTITSGLEVTWTNTPTQWSNNFFENLFGYEWELTKSPAGAHQWVAKGARARPIPDAHDPSKKHRPTMLTTDLALRVDPAYEKISRRFLEQPRPVRRRLRPRVVQADPPRHGPARPLSRPRGARRGTDLAGPDSRRRSRADRRRRTRPRSRSKVLASGLTVSRAGLHRLGVGLHLPRLRQARRRQRRAASASPRRRTGPSTSPSNSRRCYETLEGIRNEFNAAQTGGKKVSLADLIVLAGCAGVEQAANSAGHDVKVPFTPGRTDASQEQTDVESFASLEPSADGFRNYLKARYSVPAEHLLIDKAQLLTLTAPEMTVLIGGLRVLKRQRRRARSTASSPAGRRR